MSKRAGRSTGDEREPKKTMRLQSGKSGLPERQQSDQDTNSEGVSCGRTGGAFVIFSPAPDVHIHDQDHHDEDDQDADLVSSRARSCSVF